MLEYGKTVSNGQPIKKKKQLIWEEGSYSRPRSEPIPLQPYFLPFYHSTLLVVGCNETDTLFLTSPIEQNVRKLYGYSKWLTKTESYEHMLGCIKNDGTFIPLIYYCTKTKLDRDWHTSIHLRERDAVQLYVIPKPPEYFPMLFVNCSMGSIINVYGTITTLMISRNDSLCCSPFNFTCSICRPIIFIMIKSCIESRQRLSNIDMTDEEFVIRRTEWLNRELGYMVSDYRCRSNCEALPSDKLCNYFIWLKVESLFYIYNCNNRLQQPPYYTQNHQDCQGHCNQMKQ